MFGGFRTAEDGARAALRDEFEQRETDSTRERAASILGRDADVHVYDAIRVRYPIEPNVSRHVAGCGFNRGQEAIPGETRQFPLERVLHPVEEFFYFTGGGV